MIMDFLTYLPTDILTKVDRAAMAHSLETRIPYLDLNVIKASINLEDNSKIRGKKTKWILRDILNKYIPRHLLDRPKMGFSIPIESWLRNPLKDWAFDLVSDRNLTDIAYLNHSGVLKLWTDHQSGFKNNQHKLWNILILLSWLRENRRY